MCWHPSTAVSLFSDAMAAAGLGAVDNTSLSRWEVTVGSGDLAASAPDIVLIWFGSAITTAPKALPI